ncbi:class I SAM-dependent DNA methyltransferase [Micromonospora deserti]|uniref:class I SAM-dependent DNA methyltransferase n=1 Tax=Micromonospora deserti TaxID=2070366 RepID=UPI001F24D21E|nr:methyltransferase domain-containing protein [Micromonospora deserti]
MKADHYDSFAERYSADSESNLINGYYERPAMIGLAGDVNGRRILDAGCGSGPLSAALRERGAIVTGFDSSPAMVELAERRLGEDATGDKVYRQGWAFGRAGLVAFARTGGPSPCHAATPSPSP